MANNDYNEKVNNLMPNDSKYSKFIDVSLNEFFRELKGTIYGKKIAYQDWLERKEKQVEDWETARQERIDIAYEELESCEEAMKENDIDKLIGILVKESSLKYPEEYKYRIVEAAYEANFNAHFSCDHYYPIKSWLLEQVVLLWDSEKDSYGINKDEDNMGNVLYFDIPGNGQVSFHLVDTQIDPKTVPKYPYAWKGTVNFEMPTDKKIDNYHDLMFALHEEGKLREEQKKGKGGCYLNQVIDCGELSPEIKNVLVSTKPFRKVPIEDKGVVEIMVSEAGVKGKRSLSKKEIKNADDEYTKNEKEKERQQIENIFLKNEQIIE
ncbi:MAG: hypothetical protein RSE00_04925 [Clostridia bacterium]